MSSKPPSESPLKRILDNHHTQPLAEYLNRHLPRSETLRLVSAYFSVYGYEQIADALDTVKQVKFLFGDPASASATASGETERITFSIDEEGLQKSIADIMGQRQLAKRCADWVDQPSVQVRTIAKSNFMHGKMYHMTHADGSGAAAVGSSNLTKSGLGAAGKPNIELNISADDATRAELQEWFELVWNDENLTKDAKEDLLAALARWHEEYSPQFLYYRTLYKLFEEDLKERAAEDESLEKSHLYTSQIWKALYAFQKDGAKSVIARLLRHNGCILADSVGLGKTYTALAVIKYFELRNERVLVLCPKKLEQNWSIYRAAMGAKNNPFDKDKFGYIQLAHTDLSRDSGTTASGVNLANFNWSGFDLIVIDESHNFRNRSGTSKSGRLGRYQKLMEDVIKSGSKTKVLLLSATPVNTSLKDLRNQISLMTEERDGAFADALQIPSIETMFGVAEKQFKKWEDNTDKKKTKSELLNALGGDFLRLLSALTIARSRRQIEKFYGEHIKEYGEFPKRAAPENEHPHTDTEESFTYEQVDGLIRGIKFHIYQPSNYVSDAAVEQRLKEEKERLRFNQRTREIFLAAMMRINYLKRFESSAEALRLTLERTVEKVNKQITRIDKYLASRQDADAQLEGEEYQDEEDDGYDEFLVNSKARQPFHLSELYVEKWREDMGEDLKALKKVLKLIASVSADEGRDGKLQELRKRIRSKVREGNKKLLIFTTFKDTAEYLYKHTKGLCGELGVNIAMVAGDETKRQDEKGANTFTAILDDFSPVARGAMVGEGEDIDILIATDCISEGQNLQDCDTVLNYDIHWNPVRIIQRFGRIDRIGSKNTIIKMVNFWPHPDHEAYLKLRSRVIDRMMLLDAAATGDNNTLDQQEIDRANKEDLAAAQNFHDDLARRIRDEVVDIEDIPDAVTMGDLTLDYFLTQLLRYLQEHREELERAPDGIYAVTDAATDNAPAGEGSGVIFFFQQKKASEGVKISPTHPFYLVHVLADGGVFRYHMQAGEILRLFEILALPHQEPLAALCDAFVAEIQTADGMAAYGKMADAAVNSIEGKAKEAMLDGLTQRGAVLPKRGERPSADNLELITWLIVRQK